MRKLNLLFVFLFLPAVAFGQSSEIRSIKIHSTWGGLGPAGDSTLSIERRSGRYLANGKQIPDEKVARLIAAIDAPTLDQPTMDNMGFTQDWLDRNAEIGVKEELSVYYSFGNREQQALYRKTFRDREFMARLLKEIYSGGFHTDDYPHLSVEIVWADGRQLTVASEAQQTYMLPWDITRDGKTTKTFNADIAHALVDLMPAKFTNRERLLGDRWPSALASIVLRRIEDEWKLLEAEGKIGPYLEQLRGKFTIRKAAITPYHNVDYGQPTINGNTSEKNLEAQLTAEGFPPNFNVAAVLEFKDNEVLNAGGLLRDVWRYVTLIDEIPWLKEFIVAHPDEVFNLRFVHDRSFSRKAMDAFAEDMRTHGKADLAEQVASVQDRIALLAVGKLYPKAYWLVMPDRRLILWRFSGYSLGTLRWKAEDFPNWNCSFQGQCAWRGDLLARRAAIVRVVRAHVHLGSQINSPCPKDRKQTTAGNRCG